MRCGWISFRPRDKGRPHLQSRTFPMFNLYLMDRYDTHYICGRGGESWEGIGDTYYHVLIFWTNQYIIASYDTQSIWLSIDSAENT